MKMNMLKKCACLLLIGGLFAPTYQIKADGDLGEFGIAVVAGIFLVPFVLAIASEKALKKAKKEANKLTINEAHEIITAFFNESVRQTMTSDEFLIALIKFNLPLRTLIKPHSPNQVYRSISNFLQRLPEDFQELFKAISEEEFCKNMKQLKSDAPAIKVEETTQETTTEQEQVISTETCSEAISDETVSA